MKRNLLHASCRGDMELCRLLLAEGASVNVQDVSGRTPLMIATLKNHVDVMKLLLENNCNLNLTTKNGRTALHLAVWNKRVTMTTLLLKHKCSTTTQDHFGDTPLMLATLRGYARLVNAILSTQTCDLHAHGPENDTALHYAARLGRRDCVHLLCKFSAAVDQENIWGLTPLLLATMHGHVNTAMELVKAGANVNSVDRTGRSVLHYAVRQSRPDFVSELLLKGATVDATDFQGNRPLIDAINHSDTETVALLILAKCDINAPKSSVATPNGGTMEQLSPVEVAVQGGKLQVADLLVQAGCDVRALRHNLRTGGLAAGAQADEAVRNWAERSLHRPLSLATQSRRELLRRMRTLPCSIHELLTIPPGLTNYLNYGDLLSPLKDQLKDPNAQTVFKLSQMQVLVRY